MNRAIIAAIALSTISGCGQQAENTQSAAQRQTESTNKSLDAADRGIGMPRIANFSQRKLLKNAYEDMDQTTLVYVYTQALDGRFVCLGQAVGYGVSLGTQFTAPYYNKEFYVGGGAGPNPLGEVPQPEPNGLYMPESGAATIVNLINPATGEARTGLIEQDVVTIPFKLPATAVAIPCPGDVDPAKVKDAKETSQISQRN